MNSAWGTQKVGVEEFHEGPQVADVVFDRRTGEGDAVVGAQTARGSGLFGLGVFDVLGFVEDDSGPIDSLHSGDIALEQGVAGYDDGLCFCGSFERRLPSCA